MTKTIFFYILLISILSAFNSCKKEKSECLTCPPPPPDTTSHIIQWQLPDTLGAQGIIRDVWVFDRNNAWAVGEIYLNDSTGKPNMENPYNAAHWDGSKWELKKIESIICGSNTYTTSPLFTIFAFANNDIWYSDGGEIIHWNGQIYISDCSMNAMLTGAIKKIWGMSNNNLYAVGNAGTVIHFNGRQLDENDEQHDSRFTRYLGHRWLTYLGNGNKYRRWTLCCITMQRFKLDNIV
ncbi:MAG: hypothetical protein ABR936_17165 [Bacteroidota bacterium]|jgi:hypothetical protein